MSRNYIKKDWKSQIGIYKEMKCGIKAKIINYRSYNDIDIEFEDGYIIKTRCQCFENGSIKHNKIKTIYTKDRIGESKIMNNGMVATIIEYTFCDDIKVKFEDNFISKTTYKKFKDGCVGNDNLNNIRNIKSRTGEISTNNQGCEMKILEYNNCEDIVVEFKEPHYITNSQYKHFKKGNIVNPYFRNKFGIGCIGNTITTQEFKKYKMSYKYWANMLRRCYFDKRSENNPCFVCDEWLCFENFERWFDKNYIEYDNKELNISLDKDIKSLFYGIEKQYSPNTCSFIPSKINISFNPEIKGYWFDEKYNKYRVKINKIDGNTKHITAITEEDSKELILNGKKKLFKELANFYKDYISEEVYFILCNYYEKEGSIR